MCSRRKPAGGFTLLDLVTIVAVLVVLALALLPLIAKRYAPASRVSCANQLKQIGYAMRQWSIDNGNMFPMQVSVINGGARELVETGRVYPSFLVMSNELNTPKLLICPEDNRKRSIANTFEQVAPRDNYTARYIPLTNDHSVSYFVGLGAEELLRPAALLSGDDNFLINGNPVNSGLLLLQTDAQVLWTKERHKERGNFLFADGSVRIITNFEIQSVLIKTGIATNRLALP